MTAEHDELFEAGFPLDDDQLRMLGAITALGALVDAFAEGIVAGLVGGADWTKVLTLTSGQNVSWRLEKIAQLCTEREE